MEPLEVEGLRISRVGHNVPHLQHEFYSVDKTDLFVSIRNEFHPNIVRRQREVYNIVVHVMHDMREQHSA